MPMNLGRWLYYGDFVAIPLVIAALLAHVLSPGHFSIVPALALYAVVGIFAWTLVEYLVHRFAYHEWPVLAPFHAAHHDKPAALLGFPSFISVGLFLLVVFAPLQVLDSTAAAGLTCGMLLGYLVYVFVHHASHHLAIGPDHLLYKARLRHLAYHHREESNYGVITSFWDFAFGTAGRRLGRTAVR